MFNIYIKCYNKSEIGVSLSNIAHLQAESYPEIIRLFKQFKHEFRDKYCEFQGLIYNEKYYIGEL